MGFVLFLEFVALAAMVWLLFRIADLRHWREKRPKTKGAECV